MWIVRLQGYEKLQIFCVKVKLVFHFSFLTWIIAGSLFMGGVGCAGGEDLTCKSCETSQKEISLVTVNTLPP